NNLHFELFSFLVCPDHFSRRLLLLAAVTHHILTTTGASSFLCLLSLFHSKMSEYRSNPDITSSILFCDHISISFANTNSLKFSTVGYWYEASLTITAIKVRSHLIQEVTSLCIPD
ncbi:hypothetical protein PMAYCL1PPCAC_27415, partial [Pristionchus mayeri]